MRKVMSVLANARQDWAVNRGRPKIQAALLLFRLTSAARLSRTNRLRTLRYRLLYAIYVVSVDWILGIELPPDVVVGPRLRIFHGQGLVINSATVLGCDVTLRHQVTIGNNGRTDNCPVIGDRVSIGAGAVLLGGIIVGEDASVGALALVTTDVPVGGAVRAPRATTSERQRSD